MSTTLLDLCLQNLAKYSHEVKSLKFVPNDVKRKIWDVVNRSGKTDKRFISLFFENEPTEVYVPICTDLRQELLIEMLCACKGDKLKVLILDDSFGAMTSLTISEFLNHSPEGFKSLTTLSLKGSFTLKPLALLSFLRTSTLLEYLNLDGCHNLSSDIVVFLADLFSSTLRGLNIARCLRIREYDRLLDFKNLIFLSVAELSMVDDTFLESFFKSCASNLTTLSVASCKHVTDKGILHIATYGKKLEEIDISKIDQLTDRSLAHISKGCRFLKSIRLAMNSFSDKGIACFLKESGASLELVCLNSVVDVGPETATSLATCCPKLEFLDLPWSKKLTEEYLRNILGCCSCLETLYLFGWTSSLGSLKLSGWTQVDEITFLKGNSTSRIRIRGTSMTALHPLCDYYYPKFGAQFF